VKQDSPRDIDEVVRALVKDPERAYVVGGAVRDELLAEMGRATQDHVDRDYVVTGVDVDDLLGRLRSYGRAELVGSAFGVIKFVYAGATADVALPRRETSTGTAHRAFAVQSAPDIGIAADLGRRDFTVNMLARDLRSGEILAPFGGRADLRAGRLQIVNRRAFEEDPLRILRGAQLAARFALTPTPEAAGAMQAAGGLIRTVAPERMAYELTKLLTLSARPSAGFEILREAEALEHVLPELLEGWGVWQNDFHAYTVYYHSLACCDAAPQSLVPRLAALLHDVGKPRTKDGDHFYRHEQVGAALAREALVRLRFGSDVVERVCRLVERHMYVADDGLSDAAVRRFVRRIGPQHLEDLFQLRAADIAGSGKPRRDEGSNDRFERRVWDLLNAPHVLGLSALAIDGNDVVELMRVQGMVRPDFRGDARVGAALQHCLEQVLDDPVKNEPAVLKRVVKGYLASTT